MLLAIQSGVIVGISEDDNRDFGLDAPTGAEIVKIDDTVAIGTFTQEIVEVASPGDYILGDDGEFVATEMITYEASLPDRTAPKVDPRIGMPAATVKTMKLADLDRYVTWVINRQYPIQRQLDIKYGRNGYIAGDITTMDNWIAARYTAAGAHRTAINALNVTADLIAYNYSNLT